VNRSALRVALVAPLVAPIADPFLGGSQAIVFDLGAELARRGHAVTLFGANGSLIPGVEVVALGIDAASLKPATFSGSPANDRALEERERASFLRIAYEIRRRSGDFDVVHNHAFDAPPFELLGDSHGRVVHTLHLPPVRPEVVGAAHQAAEAGATMVTVSAFMVSAWRPWLAAATIIRNGIPIDRIHPSEGKRREGWLFVGRIAPEKGLEDALVAAERAGRRLRVIGGVYDPAYHARLLPRLREHQVIGPLRRADVFAEMASAEGLLMPACWDEPFGLTAVEANAAGTPVAAYARGALPEVVADGVSGYLVAPGDVEALAMAAMRFDQIDGDRCRAFARRHFDLARMVDDYVALYGEIA
jgi:UDP-glucose:tetrahydrobiopterin glucosyltransferase